LISSRLAQNSTRPVLRWSHLVQIEESASFEKTSQKEIVFNCFSTVGEVRHALARVGYSLPQVCGRILASWSTVQKSGDSLIQLLGSLARIFEDGLRASE
jgi:hypothetical protein